MMKNGVFWDVVRTDVSEELSASIIRVTKIGELGKTLTVTSNRSTLQRFSETSVLTRATQRNIPEVGILNTRNINNSAGLIHTQIH
jgi:hypothetical protein